MPVTPKFIDRNDFSTETGSLRPGESDFRNEICLNGRWDFQPVSLPDGFVTGETIPELPLPQDGQWESVKLKVPSPWNINGFVDADGIPGGDFVCYPSYPERWKQVKMGWMRRTLHVPEDWEGQYILLHFEAVCGHCQVYIDGQKVGEHFDNSMQRQYPLDAFVTPGKNHELWVGVRAPELFSVNSDSGKFTYPTGSFFNMNTAGIWQDVYLLAVPKVHVKDVFVQPDLSADQLRVQVTIENRSEQPASLTVDGVVKALKPFSFPDDGIQVLPHHDLEDVPVLEFPSGHIDIAPNAEAVITLKATVSGRLRQWDTENPNLYAALVTLAQDGKTTDCRYTRFGWREFRIKNGDFYLNDCKIQVKADSWHFMGIPQLTRRYAFAWYKALKDAGGNGVRLHAMPYPTFYLEVADEMGICVLDESAIWASHTAFNFDEPVTWERFSAHVARLVRRDRNYPSVMGWSVENEVWMALEQPFQSQENIARVGEHICKLMDIVRELDPTRDWISADGSRDWDGRFPTSVLHYENKDNYNGIKSKAGKPVGVGECTIGYYGTPKHAAAFGGDLAYRSIADRMNGVAIESYGQLKAQLLAGFSYLSVFNLAWYSLKPLPLGHAYPENAPTLADGIYFGEYQEGKPGVQPERLGPYCTTLNPGYESNLPLYIPWSMYDAIKETYSSDAPSPHEAERESPPQKPLPVIEQSEPVIFFGKTDGVHYQGLKAGGIQFSDKGAGIIYADLATISFIQKWRLQRKVNALKKRGGTIFLSGITPASEHLLEKLLGGKIEIVEREASSLVFAGEYANTDPLVDHFCLQELYFSEDEDAVIQRYGIRSDGKALLKSCSCDWRMWNYRNETSKTAALYRSEKEMPPADALVKVTLGKASVFLCTIEMRENRSTSERNRKNLWKKLMQATGARTDANAGKDAAFSTYTPAGQILKNPQAKATVRRFIPMIDMLTDDMIAEISAFSIRELVKMYGRLLMLSSKKLDQIDQALSEIVLEEGNPINTVVLERNQITRVLAAGFFAGSDPVSMLDEDFLGGESSAAPAPGDQIVRGNFSTQWQVATFSADGFHFNEMTFQDSKEYSASYMSFYLTSPRRLDNLLIEPNVPQLYLNVETGCGLRVWLNGKEIFTSGQIPEKPVNMKVPLLLQKGNNHVLMKLVNANTDYSVKVFLSSSHADFVKLLTGAVER
ncbi:MAG: glycoside hydrolase family 2 [Chloroflexi bacterium]|nr:glycoside hydrolase family 2 [Chloroflexota bacterium]